MTTRLAAILSASTLGVLSLSGCRPANVGIGVTTPAVPTVGATRESVTAEQLANILQINVHRFRYHGAPPLVWLEIEEYNQDTLPARIPEDGVIGGEVQYGPATRREGDILIWWRQQEPGGSGTLSVSVENRGGYTYGMDSNAFTWGWKSSSASTQSVELSAPIYADPGSEQTLLTFDATEGVGDPAQDKSKARRVVLKLKARFLSPVTTKDEATAKP